MSDLEEDLKARAVSLEEQYRGPMAYRGDPGPVAWTDLVAMQAYRLLGEWGSLPDPGDPFREAAVRSAADWVTRGPVDPDPPGPDGARLAGPGFLGTRPDDRRNIRCPKCREPLARIEGGRAHLEGSARLKAGVYHLRAASIVSRSGHPVVSTPDGAYYDRDVESIAILPIVVRCPGKLHKSGGPGAHGDAPSCGTRWRLTADGTITAITLDER